MHASWKLSTKLSSAPGSWKLETGLAPGVARLSDARSQKSQTPEAQLARSRLIAVVKHCRPRQIRYPESHLGSGERSHPDGHMGSPKRCVRDHQRIVLASHKKCVLGSPKNCIGVILAVIWGHLSVVWGLPGGHFASSKTFNIKKTLCSPPSFPDHNTLIRQDNG